VVGSQDDYGFDDSCLREVVVAMGGDRPGVVVAGVWNDQSK
jgi:hypothetical protein